MVDVAIVGGGPAGLAHALRLRKERPDAEIAVLEAAPRPGGWVRTVDVDGYRCEIGPQALRPTERSDRAIESLGLQSAVVVADASAKQRFIGRGGRLIALPTGPGSALTTKALSLGGKLRILREGWVTRGDDPEESLADFVARRLGPEMRALAGAIASGVFAGDAERLEVQSAFPRLAALEREHGSLLRGGRMAAKARRGQPKRPALVTFEHGMQQLVTALANAIGGVVHCEHAVTALQRDRDGWTLKVDGRADWSAREVVLALPAHGAAKVVQDLDPVLADELSAIPFSSVANVHLGYDAVLAPLSGFGFLLESGEDSPVLGAIYASSVFPSHAPKGKRLVRVMIGGVRHPEATDLPDDQVTAFATAALQRYAGVSAPAEMVHVSRARVAIAQYERGHQARLLRMRERLVPFGESLRLIGSSYDGIALGEQL